MGCIPTTHTMTPKLSTNAASILRLGDDILLQLCSQLTADELVALRKTCRYFFVISRSRYLWHHYLGRDVTTQHGPLPSYRKPMCELSSAELETLTRRALRLDVPCQQPTITRIDAKRSVQWLRLVRGQWMLAASTAGQQSILTLYSLTSTQDGKPSQLAVAHLPGPVSSGEVEVQNDRLVIAICFQSPRRMTHVLTVQSREGQLEFTTLSTFDGLSHVRALRNELIGCGVYGETRTPCLVNWKTGLVMHLPTTPEGPGQCLAMALRDDICVVVSSSSLAIYSIRSNASVELSQVVQLEHSVGNVSISAEGETLPLTEVADAIPTRMLLFTASPVGITVLGLRQHAATSFSVNVVAEEDLKRGDVLSSRPSQPHFGGSTSRLSWIYAPSSFFDRSSSSIVTGRFVARDPASPSSGTKFEILSECKDAKLPSLTTMPVMDYDDGAGLVAIGNATGELVVCNFAGPLTAEVARCYRSIPVPVVATL